MTDNEYLLSVLSAQDLGDDSAEMRALQKQRADVETILRAEFAATAPTIRYGGSKAKGTLIRESYDLDLVCYFPADETGAGDSLRDIYQNVARALAKSYYVERKTSSVRLKSNDIQRTDFHIDVVPGRYTDGTRGDCFLFQNGVDKERLKTNLQVHVDFIRGAGVTSALRLLKLWRVRHGIQLKNFIWELLCIELLKPVKARSLGDQVTHVLRSLSGTPAVVGVKDPANPEGNDLMPMLWAAWPTVTAAATRTMQIVSTSGWSAAFGQVATSSGDRSARVAAAVSAVREPTRPWSY